MKKKEQKMKEKVIIFGSGERARSTIEIINKRHELEIVRIWDNNEKKWGSSLDGIMIEKPGCNFQNCDKVMICSVYYEEIKRQLVRELQIPEKKIVDHTYCKEKILVDLIAKYEESNDIEIVNCLNHMKSHGVNVFNGAYAEFYHDKKYEVIFDDEVGMFYHIWNGKKMYLKKSLSSKDKAANYIKGLYMEQDKESPHRYLTEDYKINEGDVIIDAGVAEGFFSLDSIDLVKKVYMVEPDEEWLEALKYTFAAYREKVEIVPYFLSDTVSENTITLDAIGEKDSINLIKMDIEGYEIKALEGAKEILKKGEKKFLICSYHKENDEKNIKCILEQNQYCYENSKGYMFFLYGELDKPEFRRGIVRGYRY